MTQQSVNSYTQFNFEGDPYADSMARMETLTKSIVLKLADKGIRVPLLRSFRFITHTNKNRP